MGGDKLILDPRRSWGPVLECRRIGRPPPPPVAGVPPGELAQDGAIRIFGVIRVLSDSRLLVNVLATRRKLLSLADGELNHPPNIAKQTSRSVKSIYETPGVNISHAGGKAPRRLHLPATELFRAMFSAEAVDRDPACGEKRHFSTHKLGPFDPSEDRFRKY